MNDDRCVSSVSETGLDTLCIWCIWDVKGQLHMTCVSSVSGRRADTQVYLVYLGTPTCVQGWDLIVVDFFVRTSFSLPI